MANRRVAAFVQTYLQHMLRMQEAERAAELQGQNQSALATLQSGLRTGESSARAEEALIPKVMSDPGAAFAMMNSGRSTLAGQDISPFAQDSFAPELKQFSSAQSLSQLPDSLTALNSRISRKGAPIKSLDEVRQMVEARQSRENQLAGVNPTKVDNVDANGVKQEQFLDPRQMVGKTFQTEATGAQQGRQAGEKELGTLQTPGLLEGKVKNANLFESGTRGEKVRTAGATAGAQGYGNESGQLKAKGENLDLLGKIAQAGQTNKTTGEERTAAGQFGTLINAHQNILNLTRKTGGLQGGVLTATNYPSLTKAVSMAYAPEQAQLAQAAKDWAGTALYIISGVSARPDELDRLISTSVPFKGEPPDVSKAKEQSRNVFIQAAQLKAGHAGPEAGASLARAVKAGTVDSELVTKMSMEPDVKAGYLAELSK